MGNGPDCKVNIFFIPCRIRVRDSCPKQSNLTFLLFFRYPIIFPRDKCAGDLGDQPGVRSYGLRPADERYDVYCYTDGLKGKKILVKVEKDKFPSLQCFHFIIVVGLLFTKTVIPFIPLLPLNSDRDNRPAQTYWMRQHQNISSFHR